MNMAMQSFGYGLAALLFCIAVLGVCYNIKKAARNLLKRQQPHKGDLSGAVGAMEQVRLAVNSHSRPLLIQKRRSQKNEVESISRRHLI